ncbi:glycerophosphodiester phosphodiesterase [Patulibacter minatonensis]|uniref:glycerophosphodiester phosphodiesterase n=1 Tax=Patulibacter minatonensis TaxID=298163 RepID=UPI00047DCBD8|nr:glycerophosphodiester phosphodiesterase [Patulibacter minatonensis]
MPTVDDALTSPPTPWPGTAARAEGRTLRFGHMGCHAVVPGNTIASIEHAATLGVDVVEFDALPDGRGGLRLAHDPVDLAARPDAPTMAEALDRLCEPDLAHLGINLDSKVPGDEAAIVAALRDRDLVGRTLVSSTETATLRALRAVDPGVRIGRSVPKVSRDWSQIRWARVPVAGAILGLRRALPRILVRELRTGRIDAVMAHWSLITPSFARAVTAAGELYVWTVDDADRADAIRACGVTGVTSNDPRLLRW